jgi:outer membrane protein assembly factor BamA
LGIKAEYVFDNTLDIALNTKNGTRYKVFAELVKGFDVSLSENPSFKVNKGFMAVFGTDFRHYQRVLRYSVLAGRVAGATSLGKEKILYMLGGTDNWMFPQFDQNIPLPPGDGFLYRSMATNLRGFTMNARNGNSYALVNTEFRMPVLKYLFQKSRSSFVNNFQVVGFFDIGTAWQGLNPFDEKSPLNTWTSSNNNVIIKVNYFRDPVIFGYGTGIRTLLFGYFLRLDYAWGVETRNKLDPKLYFSVGLDF